MILRIKLQSILKLAYISKYVKSTQNETRLYKIGGLCMSAGKLTEINKPQNIGIITKLKHLIPARSRQWITPGSLSLV